MSAGWIAAALVSTVAHVGFAAWVEQAEPKKKPRPPIELQLAKIAKPVEPPKLEPPPPPPPPPQTIKPKLVKQLTKTPPPPVPETQRVGIPDDASADNSDLAFDKGVTTDGQFGNGNSMKEDVPPPPPAPPAPMPPAPPPPPTKKFFPSYEVTKLPQMKNAAQPEIPDAFRQAQREALVVVEVEIDAKGRVVGARVLRHADFGLDDAALAAAKASEFEPALMGNTPVPVRYQIPYRFKVRG